MPLAAILGLATAFLEVCKVLIDKFLPARHVPTFNDLAGKPVDWTQEQIRAYGIKKGIIDPKGDSNE